MMSAAAKIDYKLKLQPEQTINKGTKLALRHSTKTKRMAAVRI